MHCNRHYEEPAAASCRTCNHPYCTRCLVYSFGPSKPPFCVGCAIHASGIRSGTRAPASGPALDVAAPSRGAEPTAPGTDRRLERAYRRAERTAQKQAVKTARKTQRSAAPPQALAMVDGSAAPSSRVPAPSTLLAHDVGIGSSF